MKKGIIVEHRPFYTIIMDREGVFHKAEPIREKDIGVETIYKPKPSRVRSFFMMFQDHKWRWLPMALVCLLIISPLYLLLGKNETYAVISIDINPSLNIKINQNYEVLEAVPMNKSAEEMLKQIDIQGKSLTAFTDDMLDYLPAHQENAVPYSLLMAISYFDEKDNPAFQEAFHQHLQKLGYSTAIYEVSDQLRRMAEKEYISMNKVVANLLKTNETDAIQPVSVDQEDSALFLSKEKQELIKNFYDHASEEEKEAFNIDQNHSSKHHSHFMCEIVRIPEKRDTIKMKDLPKKAV
ncbi:MULTISPECIES: anti-sigma-I factor RsgI family protein [Gracilibacillus]|uniref:anti-sigma-I factor RsgI family protein n=1 Tax=Gracilibacillus TaxID=74385 RepID=UPI0008268984|nr:MULTISPECIES: hypothetical protein [Gracilibacillus]